MLAKLAQSEVKVRLQNMETEQLQLILSELNSLNPEDILAWAYAHSGERAAILTSFQNTGCVLIDMAQRVAPAFRVATVDTLRLPAETYELIEQIEKKYRIHIERFYPDPERLRRMVADHGEFLFFDSKGKQEYCCQVRKVEPNERALDTLDVWITGLRRDQSAARQDTPKAQIVRRNDRDLIKLCPLADWSEAEVVEYCRNRSVPLNALYEKGYTSIGCAICTTPTRSSEDKRAGRWRWLNYLGREHAKECGIHSQGGGI